MKKLLGSGANAADAQPSALMQHNPCHLFA